jgi:hypothetical protein
MAAQSSRSGRFGFLRQKPPKPSFKGTSAAFEVGEKANARSKGASAALREVVRLHFANTRTSSN